MADYIVTEIEIVVIEITDVDSFNLDIVCPDFDQSAL